MKRILFFATLIIGFVLFCGCNKDDNTELIQGDWKLIRINDGGSYRIPNPDNDTCFRLHFFKNNSLLGESVSTNFSATYELKSRSRILFSGFLSLTIENEDNDNELFLQNLLKVDKYGINKTNDTLKLFVEDKVYLSFVRTR